MRKLFVLIHRYAGLYMTFFLIVAGLTGSILAFDGEIRDWLNPPVKAAVQAAPQLDALTLLERALALAPQGQIRVLSLNRKPDEAYVAHIEPRTDPTTGKPYALPFNTLTLDPYTGDEIGRSQRPEGLWPITPQNFIAVIIALHYRLAVPGSIGTWLFGIAALIWTLDCFVGFYLTLPPRRRRDANLPRHAGMDCRHPDHRDVTPPSPSLALDSVQSLYGMTEVRPDGVQRDPGNTDANQPPDFAHAASGLQRGRSWWQRWKPAWLIKQSRINFDLHRASGLWFWLLLLVLAWSSVGFNLGEQVYMPAMKAAFNMPDPYGDLPTLETPLEEPRLDWREAHAIGQRLMAEQARIHGFNIQREEWMSYDAAKGVFFYYVHSDRDVSDEFGGTLVAFNGNSGQFAGLDLPSGLNTGSTLHSWIFALHMATLWGLPFKIFLCVTGLVIAALSVTGVVIWWRRRRVMYHQRERRAQAASARAPSFVDQS